MTDACQICDAGGARHVTQDWGGPCTLTRTNWTVLPRPGLAAPLPPHRAGAAGAPALPPHRAGGGPGAPTPPRGRGGGPGVVAASRFAVERLSVVVVHQLIHATRALCVRGV